MALSLDSATKDKAAYRLYSQAFASLTTEQQALINGEGASALTEIQRWATWYALTTDAPDTWEPWFVNEIVYRITDNADRQMLAARERARNDARQSALATLCRKGLTYSPGSDTEAFVYTVQNIRYWVLGCCVRRRPPFLPQPEVIDGALDAVLHRIWSRAHWNFRRRPVTLRVTRTAFTGGTYTHATKTISGLTGVSTSLPTGTVFYATGGTSVTAMEHVIASTTATTIVLAQSLGSAADSSTDIAGFYLTLEYVGLETNESFDSIASLRWRYDETNGSLDGQWVTWLDSDDFAQARVNDGMSAGTPEWFRVHQIGSTSAFRFSPIPDSSFNLKGEVWTQQPADPSSASDTTPFGKFAQEHLPHIRKAVLAEVLECHGIDGGRLHDSVTDEMETMLPTAQEIGRPPSEGRLRDVYGDYGRLMSDDYGVVGGGL